jgi:hypothetical protein
VTLLLLPDGYVINRGATVISAFLAAVGTILLGVIVFPGLTPIFDQLSEGSLLGVTVLISTAVRVLAGVLAARSMRRQSSLPSRTAAFPSALLGVTLGWLGYTLLVVLARSDVSAGRLLLELLRWLAEAALGVYLVHPGDAGVSHDWERRRHG